MSSIFFVILSSISIYAAAEEAPIADERELFPGGRFDSGIQNLEIFRYPKFSKEGNFSAPRIDRLNNESAIELSGMAEGGYKVASSPVMMKAGKSGNFSVEVDATASTTARIAIFQGQVRIAQEGKRLTAGKHHLNLDFLTRAQGKSSFVPVQIALWLDSTQAIRIDNFSVIGDGESVTHDMSMLVPNLATGVYGIGEMGHMDLRGRLPSDAVKYQIINLISGANEKSGVMATDGRLPLMTERRGAFRVDLISDPENGIPAAVAQRIYVVINRSTNNAKSRTRFGIAMEEHGQRGMTHAQLSDDNLYRLAAEIGAGTVRLFTPAMPDMVSKDGVSYNFDFLDRALDACKRFDLEPLLELGSNLPQRIPHWLKTKANSPGTIDLKRGLRTKKLHRQLEKKGGKKYLDLQRYRRYLHNVLSHVADRVDYYEVWNEPGHKFTAKDYNKILQLTRDVQKELDPSAKLIGFGSTKGPGSMGSRSERPPPQFIASMVALDGLKNIDILSYHSEHAFKYLGLGFDNPNDETGYVPLLRSVLGKFNTMPIWDTERGLAWNTSHKDRVDRDYGLEVRQPGINAVEYLEVARRLPLIHAASQAAGVERLFWFQMDSSTTTIAKTINRFGFFDAQLEPMPHLAVYDAMTEMLENAEYKRLVEEASGLRAYLFDKPGGTIALIANWKEKQQTISISGASEGVEIYNVMGNRLQNDTGADGIVIDGWPRYIVLDGISPEEVSIQ